MKAFLESLKSFYQISVFYIISTFSVKFVELFIALFSNLETNNISASLYDNIISVFFVCSIAFIFYIITTAFSKKTAIFICSLLFMLMFFSEIGLIIYNKTTGLMMGREIIERPMWEILHTIKSTLSIWLIFIIISISIVYVYISLKISKKNTSHITVIIFLTLMIVTTILSFIIKPSNDKIVSNKLRYCIYSCFIEDKKLTFNESSLTDLYKLNYDEKNIDSYKRLFPDRKVIDETYPLEREDNIDNTLGDFFDKSGSKPNIVLVVVESLGSDFFGFNRYGYSATPFLDSLSKHSLLWTNCLSTTPRSSGVIPAITASVPHGLKGFQFGNIPNHNSLLTILKDNGYNNNAFYGSWFSFDRVYDYLMAQNIDYLSPFADEYDDADNKDFDHSSWGYHDGKMFERSMEVIKKRDKNIPQFDMFITISQHDNKLELRDKDKQNYYYDKADELLASLPEDECKKLKNKRGFLAAFLYGDDCLKDFFYSYNDYYDENNTIFIITGDHSLNINPQNPLDAYHVPLIIWSPLLNKSQCFHSLASHNDITPSILALLRDDFGIETPQNIHWISDGLDTTQRFSSEVKTYFLESNGINNYILNNYLYNKNDSKVYLINDSINLAVINDSVIIQEMEHYANTMQYIDNYAYMNDKITKNPIMPNKEYVLIDSISIDSVYCMSNDEKPSVSKPQRFMIYSKKIESEYSDIKVIFTADIKYTADVTHEQFMDINIKSSKNVWWPDKISKNIIGNKFEPEQWLDMEITKTFATNNKRDKIYVYISPTEHDNSWNPEHTITLRDVKITILGKR